MYFFTTMSSERKWSALYLSTAFAPHVSHKINLHPCLQSALKSKYPGVMRLLAGDGEQSHTSNWHFPGYKKCNDNQKEKKKQYTIQLSLPKEYMKSRLNICSSVRKRNEMCERFHSSADMLRHLWLCFRPDGTLSPFFSSNNKTSSVKDYN